MSLQLGDFALAILAHDHPTIPAGRRALPSGVLLNREVDDVDAVHERLTRELGLEPLLPCATRTSGNGTASSKRRMGCCST